MSDNDDRDSGKTGAFLLGFLTGVLVCLAAGGTFALVQGRRASMEAMRAREEAEYARAIAAEAEAHAKVERERAEKALQEAKDKAKER